MIIPVALLVLAALLGLGWRSGRRQVQPILAEGYRTEAVVREYSRPNTLTPQSYPYVEYTTAEGTRTVQRLEYPRSKEDAFAIGQKVAVVSYRGHLYYEPALSQANKAVLHIALALGVGALLKLLDTFFDFL